MTGILIGSGIFLGMAIAFGIIGVALFIFLTS
jgi:hypothetical protein